MSSTAFIEPLPLIDFVAQILDKDVYSRPLSDADRVKVLYSLAWKRSGHALHMCSSVQNYIRILSIANLKTPVLVL